MADLGRVAEQLGTRAENEMVHNLVDSLKLVQKVLLHGLHSANDLSMWTRCVDFYTGHSWCFDFVWYSDFVRDYNLVNVMVSVDVDCKNLADIHHD